MEKLLSQIKKREQKYKRELKRKREDEKKITSRRIPKQGKGGARTMNTVCTAGIHFIDASCKSKNLIATSD